MRKSKYSKLLKESGKLHFVSVISLTDRQLKGFKKFCKNNCIPSGADNKEHFFIPGGIYNYSISFISTKYSGHYAKIKQYFN